METVHCLTLCLLLIVIHDIVIVTDASRTKDNQKNFITIRMPSVVSKKPDSLICTGKKLDPEESYIVRFIPHVTKDIAHHMMVYGCNLPANYKKSWICDENEQDPPSDKSVCRSESPKVVFAWALNAPDKTLPQGVGFRVSGDTRINYLVVQLHYVKAFRRGVKDKSGIILEMTKTRPQQQAGYIVLANHGFIPPGRKEYHVDSLCNYTSNYTIYPIGYRTHSHNLGVVTSGYRIRDNNWLEIGRMSPQRPQTFYDVSNPGMDIRKGDILASRCTMNSMSRFTNTYIGPTNHDEMCNFYIMYSTYHLENLRSSVCTKDTRKYTWLNDFTAEEIPQLSGSLMGIPGASEIEKHFNNQEIQK
uniref:peptidylglycine monooxygenase n=1 Tax=Arion vulgaris TaxID=1028688 RepID=A0A0B6ZEM1_9EUPU